MELKDFLRNLTAGLLQTLGRSVHTRILRPFRDGKMADARRLKRLKIDNSMINRQAGPWERGVFVVPQHATSVDYRIVVPRSSKSREP